MSGNKSTAAVWEQVEPIFRLSNFELTIRCKLLLFINAYPNGNVGTEKVGHARSLASVVQFHKFRAIICIGGDGTVHEVINGLMNRPDWEHAMRTPIGLIPAGEEDQGVQFK